MHRPLIALLALFAACLHAQVSGFLTQGGRTLFPIGCYEMPKGEAELKAMAEAGFNLVLCRNKADLDRARAAGMLGWVPVPMQLGDDAKGALRKTIEAVKDHPALAVWEGPDEVVWNFTALSNLYKNGIHKIQGEWWKQTPNALDYAEKQAAGIMPKLRAGAQLIRNLDTRKRPLWINEAAESDLKYIRQYVDSIDITGCDTYPIHAGTKDPAAAADYTDRYKSIGRGKPVYMVLQAFAWGLLKDRKPEEITYPTFDETRLMAYASLTHGARGILYWGSFLVPEDAPFRPSFYALASELAALQPFLVAPEDKTVRVTLTESKGRRLVDDRGVSWTARRVLPDWLIVLVNEDPRPHFGVEVRGLGAFNGRQLVQLYGSETVKVERGEFITRLMPNEVKVFATSRKWESPRRTGRDFSR